MIRRPSGPYRGASPRVRTRTLPPTRTPGGPMRGLAFAFLLVLGLPFVALAQTGTIQGRITDQDGQPIAGATVSLEGTGLGTQTDGQGGFALRGVPAGSYTIRVEAVGHALESESITVAEGAEVRRDYALRSEAIIFENLFASDKAKGLGLDDGFPETGFRAHRAIALACAFVEIELAGKLDGAAMTAAGIGFSHVPPSGS